jgi:hypothetical protein
MAEIQNRIENRSYSGLGENRIDFRSFFKSQLLLVFILGLYSPNFSLYRYILFKLIPILLKELKIKIKTESKTDALRVLANTGSIFRSFFKSKLFSILILGLDSPDFSL